MNTSCLYDLIGIRGSGAATPESGEYINSLPGLPMELLDMIANADQITYLNVWRDIQERAIPKFTEALTSLLKKRYRLKTIQTTTDLLRRKDKTIVTARTAQYRGFTIELIFPNPSYIAASNYQAISIQSLSIYLSAVTTQPITFKIFDLDTEDIIGSFSLAVNAQSVGWNEVKVNTYYKSDRIFIGYDASEVDSVKMEIPQYGIDNFCGCISKIYSYGCNASIKGATTADLDNDMIVTQSGSSTYGLSAIFSVGCNYDFLICNNKRSFVTPLKYYLGAEVMVEALYSPRINIITTIDVDETKEKEARFLSDAERQLDLIVDGLDLNLYDSCFECHSQVTIKEARM